MEARIRQIQGDPPRRRRRRGARRATARSSSARSSRSRFGGDDDIERYLVGYIEERHEGMDVAVARVAARRRAARQARRRRGHLRGERQQAHREDRLASSDASRRRPSRPGASVDLPGRGTHVRPRAAGPAGRADGPAAARLDGERRPQLVLVVPRRSASASASSPSTTAATVAASGRGGRSACATRPTTPPRCSTCSASIASSPSATRWAARSPSCCGAGIPTRSAASCCARQRRCSPSPIASGGAFTAMGALVARVARRRPPSPGAGRRRLDPRPPPGQRAAVEWVAEELQRNDWTAVLGAGAALGRFDSRPWLGEVDVPTAVVLTRFDRVVSPRRQAAMARARSRARSSTRSTATTASSPCSRVASCRCSSAPSRSVAEREEAAGRPAASSDRDVTGSDEAQVARGAPIGLTTQALQQPRRHRHAEQADARQQQVATGARQRVGGAVRRGAVVVSGGAAVVVVVVSAWAAHSVSAWSSTASTSASSGSSVVELVGAGRRDRPRRAAAAARRARAGSARWIGRMAAHAGSAAATAVLQRVEERRERGDQRRRWRGRADR